MSWGDEHVCSSRVLREKCLGLKSTSAQVKYSEKNVFWWRARLLNWSVERKMPWGEEHVCSTEVLREKCLGVKSTSTQLKYLEKNVLGWRARLLNWSVKRNMARGERQLYWSTERKMSWGEGRVCSTEALRETWLGVGQLNSSVERKLFRACI